MVEEGLTGSECGLRGGIKELESLEWKFHNVASYTFWRSHPKDSVWALGILAFLSRVYMPLAPKCPWPRVSGHPLNRVGWVPPITGQLQNLCGIP